MRLLRRKSQTNHSQAPRSVVNMAVVSFVAKRESARRASSRTSIILRRTPNDRRNAGPTELQDARRQIEGTGLQRVFLLSSRKMGYERVAVKLKRKTKTCRYQQTKKPNREVAKNMLVGTLAACLTALSVNLQENKSSFQLLDFWRFGIEDEAFNGEFAGIPHAEQRDNDDPQLDVARTPHMQIPDIEAKEAENDQGASDAGQQPKEIILERLIVDFACFGLLTCAHVVATVEADDLPFLDLIGAIRAARRQADLDKAIGTGIIVFVVGDWFGGSFICGRFGGLFLVPPHRRRTASCADDEDGLTKLATNFLAQRILGRFDLFLALGANDQNGSGHRGLLSRWIGRLRLPRIPSSCRIINATRSSSHNREGVAVPSAAPARILIALATYNERDNLAPLLAEIHKTVPSADLLVIDDNSPDGTGRLADELAARNPHLHVLHRPGDR